MLRHNEARAIAEALWGSGGTHAYRTNRHGAFYFSCSGHGGYVIDVAAFTPDELTRVYSAINPGKGEQYHRFTYGKSNRFHHPYKKRGTRFSTDAVETVGTFLVFEEDCDWSIVDHWTGIRIIDWDKTRPFAAHMMARNAATVFARWIAPRMAGDV